MLVLRIRTITAMSSERQYSMMVTVIYYQSYH